MIEAFNSAIDADHSLAFVMNHIINGQNRRKDREFTKSLDSLADRLGL